MEIINEVFLPSGDTGLFPFTFFSGYPQKVVEVERILGHKIRDVKLEVIEIQSKDPEKVVRHKAIEAWKQNNGNPVIVEDTSLFIMALDGLPGTYSSDFTQTVDQRRLICMISTHKKDWRVMAKVMVAIYDGKEVKIWGGETKGSVSQTPRGLNGFGWDDIFIPDGQPKRQQKTFAEMAPAEKDKYSMRKKAWNKFLRSPLNLAQPIYKLPEPYDDEMKRIRHEEFSHRAKNFAFKLEPIETINKVNPKFAVNKYKPVIKKDGKFYSRYQVVEKSASLGLILTNVDLNKINCAENREPVLWQMGPERRRLALAMRALYFDENQNGAVYKLINQLETGKSKIALRSNRRFKTVEESLGLTNDNLLPTRTPAISEIGYNKISSDYLMSRRQAIKTGLFNVIGKYPRKIIGLGSMPPASGWRDTLVMACLGHMICFVPRNSIFAGRIDLRIELIKQVKGVIDELDIPLPWKKIVKRNVGISLGAELTEVETAKRFYKEAGIRLFRIYTIASDQRVVETAKRLRKELGDDIEIFVGQIADKKQALKLIAKDIMADGLILGHGGGRQCTSAINGMAITTLEDLYALLLDSQFNRTTLLLEGGVGKSVGTALVLGVDGILYNQQLVHGTIETGDLFVSDLNGKICQPYPGSASPVTQIIESEDPILRLRRTDAAGRTYNSEGKPGFMYYDAKAPSMAFWVNEFLNFAGRTLADLGVKDMSQLRTLLAESDDEFLRIMTEKTQYLSDAYGNGK